MSKLAKIEPQRETRYRIEERWVVDGTVAHYWSLPGSGAEAWAWFQAYRQTYPWRYTPYGARRLVLLAAGGGK